MAQSDEKPRDRIEALRELARQQGAEAPPTDQAPAPAETFTQRARLTKRPRRWRLPLIADLLVAVILGSGAWWLWQRQATQLAPIPAELVLDLPAMKLFCPQSLAWSPDGNRVAVQLSDNTCSQQGAHLLAIFDARQGKLLQRFDLDLTLTRLGVTHVSGSPGEFGPPLWSPDGKLITMPYVFEQGQAYQQISTWGLLLLPLDSNEAPAHPQRIAGVASSGTHRSARRSPPRPRCRPRSPIASAPMGR